MSQTGSPSLRGTDRAVFLIGAALVLALELYAFWRVPQTDGSALPASGGSPGGASAPATRLGTPDPAGILWFTITDGEIAPPRAVMEAGVPVQLRLRNTSASARTFRLRADPGGSTVQALEPVAGGAEEGRPLTLPRGTYVIEDIAEPTRAAVIEAR